MCKKSFTLQESEHVLAQQEIIVRLVHLELTRHRSVIKHLKRIMRDSDLTALQAREIMHELNHRKSQIAHSEDRRAAAHASMKYHRRKIDAVS